VEANLLPMDESRQTVRASLAGTDDMVQVSALTMDAFPLDLVGLRVETCYLESNQVGWKGGPLLGLIHERQEAASLKFQRR
jgi:hypothetical protein